jgi:hypothetical protein
MLIKNFLIGLNPSTALITFVMIEVNKFRNLFWPSATVVPMTTGGTPLGTVNLGIWLYSRFENLTQHLLQLITQFLLFLFKPLVFLPQLFNLCLKPAPSLFPFHQSFDLNNPAHQVD